MEGSPPARIENKTEVSAAFKQSFFDSEITEKERIQFQQAEQQGYIRTKKAGPYFDVEFLPIRDASKLPSSLMHLANAKNTELIKASGLRSRKGRIYLQSPDLIVEPEDVSIYHTENAKIVCVELDTRLLLEEKKVIILDPESMHGYDGEFMHAFVVYGEISPSMMKSVKEYKPNFENV